MKSSSLLNSTIIYAVSNILVTGIPFLLLPVLTRVLNPAEYGAVAMFSVIIGIFSAFTGLETAGVVYIRYYKIDKADFSQYVMSLILILFCSVFIFLSIVAIFGDKLELIVSLPKHWLIIAVFVAAMQFVVSLNLSIWQVSKQAWKYGAMQIGQTGLNAAISIWLVVIIDLAWKGRMLAIAISTAFAMVATLVIMWRDGWIVAKIRGDFIKDALRFGIPLIPHTLGGLLIASADKIIVTNLLDIYQTGIYTVSVQIGMVLSVLTVSFNRAYAPWLFQNLESRNLAQRKQLVRYTYLYFIVLLIIAIIIGSMAPILLNILVGKSFYGGAEIIIFISVGYAFAGMYFMVTNYVILAGATARLAVITLTAGFVNILITYILVKEYGISGAGYGFLVSQALLFFGTWILASKVSPMPWLQALRSS